MTCAFAHDDAAYVLGALSPTERAAFEGHLAGCEECSRSVRDLAGLPGLLARVPPEVLDDVREPEPVPPGVLAVLAHRERRRRRRWVWTAAGSAAALVAAAVLSVALVRDTDPRTEPPPQAAAEAMQSIGGAPVTGELALTPVAWGTRLDLVCSYPDDEHEYGAVADPPAYVMVIRTRAGDVERVASWRGLPGRTMRLTGATAYDVDDIASVEVRTASGDPVLELTA